MESESGRTRLLIVLAILAVAALIAVTVAIATAAWRPQAPVHPAPSQTPAEVASTSSPTATPSVTESPDEPAETPSPRPLLLPAEVASRPALPWCGHDPVVRTPAGDIGDPRPWECLLDTRDAGGAAELILDSVTVEGAPIRQIFRSLPNGEIEWWADSTRDPLGAGQWTRTVCRRLDSLQADPAQPAVHIPEDCAEPEVIIGPDDPDTPTGDEMAMLEALVLFARSPDGGGLGDVPLSADGVWLGLGDELIVRHAAAELSKPAAWRLDAAAFRGRVGPFSALELLADWSPAMIDAHVHEAAVSVGEHPHCASPPVPPPPEVAALRRLSVQPVGASSCLSWWTVDLFVEPGGAIAAITLDLYEP